MEKGIPTKYCRFCELKLKLLDSNFCSELCFDEWYSRQELPSLVVSMAIKAMQKRRQNADS